MSLSIVVAHFSHRRGDFGWPCIAERIGMTLPDLRGG